MADNQTTPPFGCGPLAWRLFWGIFVPIYAATFLTLVFFAAHELPR